VIGDTDGNDVIVGLEGNDHIQRNHGGTDYMCGNGGSDSIEGGPVRGGGIFIDGGTGDDQLLGAERRPNTIKGGPGSDIITGQLRNDMLFGGRGDDQVSALDGDDLLVGGIGFDTLYGGPGFDTCRTGEQVSECEEADLSTPAGTSDPGVDTSRQTDSHRLREDYLLTLNVRDLDGGIEWRFVLNT
jgi:Ca2+-binding RTX toxin-like protein